MKILRDNGVKVTPMQKWRAIAWSIIHFNWLYKMIKGYQGK